MYSINSKIVVLLIALFSANLAFCQEEEVKKTPEPEPESKSKSSSQNNEIGVNVALFSSFFGGVNSWYYYDYYDYGFYPFLLGDYNQSAISYRHYFGDVSVGLALGGNYASNTDKLDGGNTYTYKYSMLNARLGLEKQVSFAGKWQLYYGIGISTSIYRGTSEYDFTSPFNADYLTKTSFTTFNAGPVLGFRYRFGGRFSVSADASLNATYQSLVSITTGSSPSIDKSNGFNISISPIRGFFFNYYF